MCHLFKTLMDWRARGVFNQSDLKSHKYIPVFSQNATTTSMAPAAKSPVEETVDTIDHVIKSVANANLGVDLDFGEQVVQKVCRFNEIHPEYVLAWYYRIKAKLHYILWNPY